MSERKNLEAMFLGGPLHFSWHEITEDHIAKGYEWRSDRYFCTKFRRVDNETNTSQDFYMFVLDGFDITNRHLVTTAINAIIRRREAKKGTEK